MTKQAAPTRGLTWSCGADWKPTKMGERLLKADEESEYWGKNCDRYLWMLEVVLQSMWRLTYDLGVVCHEWTGSSSKTREIILSVTSCINELNIRLKKAADKWDEANSCWLELFDTDYSIRKSGNLDMLQWRGHSVDDRKNVLKKLRDFTILWSFIISFILNYKKEKVEMIGRLIWTYRSIQGLGMVTLILY